MSCGNMTKRKVTVSKKRAKRQLDVVQNTFRVVMESVAEKPAKAESTDVTEDEISRVMRALGSKGGKIGGKKRAESMTPERRREIALKAARSRWDREQPPALGRP